MCFCEFTTKTHLMAKPDQKWCQAVHGLNGPAHTDCEHGGVVLLRVAPGHAPNRLSKRWKIPSSQSPLASRVVCLFVCLYYLRLGSFFFSFFYFLFFYFVFFHYHSVPLHHPPSHNHQTVVHVRESFFLFAQYPQPLTSPTLNCLPALYLWVCLYLACWFSLSRVLDRELQACIGEMWQRSKMAWL